jgi:hypothetical protein
MSKGCRRPCKECPWTNENKHNLKFQSWSERMSEMGKNQACHMETKDVWGRNTEISEHNECIGRKLMHENEIRKEKLKTTI